MNTTGCLNPFSANSSCSAPSSNTYQKGLIIMNTCTSFTDAYNRAELALSDPKSLLVFSGYVGCLPHSPLLPRPSRSN